MNIVWILSWVSTFAESLAPSTIQPYRKTPLPHEKKDVQSPNVFISFTIHWMNGYLHIYICTYMNQTLIQQQGIFQYEGQ